MTEQCPDLDRFEQGELDAGSFPHSEHVRMGFAMLRRYDFAEAVFRYSRILKAMTARAGKPKAFHQTITVAFLSLIAERIDAGDYADFHVFVRANSDLLEKAALARWYSSDRLALDTARRTFLLPEPAP
jgi:hypothetical protein